MLCLCDTNGGTLTGFLAEIVAEVRARFDGIIGIHTHNDSDVAVANALAAVEKGATHVQGCLNGYGERCGNANLASIIANLELKLGHTTIGPEKLQALTSACRYIAELANLPLRERPAFRRPERLRPQGRRPRQRRHEGFVHLRAHRARNWSATTSACWSAISPDAATSLYQLQQHGLADRLTEEARRELLERIKEMEYQGYDLEAADGTFELFVRQALHPGVNFFEVRDYEVVHQVRPRAPRPSTVSTRGRHPHRRPPTATAR